MNISSRTPEGSPNRCPLCGHELCIEPSPTTGDAPCPHCGHLLWFAPASTRPIKISRRRFRKAALVVTMAALVLVSLSRLGLSWMEGAILWFVGIFLWGRRLPDLADYVARRIDALFETSLDDRDV